MLAEAVEGEVLAQERVPPENWQPPHVPDSTGVIVGPACQQALRRGEAQATDLVLVARKSADIAAVSAYCASTQMHRKRSVVKALKRAEGTTQKACNMAAEETA